jgi:hypothetical protein
VNGVLIPAYPAVLRAGLPVVVERDGFGAGGRFKFVAFWCGKSDGDVYVCDASERGYTKLWDADVVSLDLRDPAVRDAVARAIWRKLRRKATPGALDMREVSPNVWESVEPATAPQWSYDDNGDSYWLTALYGYNDDVHETFSPADGSCCRGARGHVDHDANAVPSLVSISINSPDRDILALAEVAKAVLA